MLKKTLMIATLGTALAAGTLSTTASAQGDPFLGALVGGGIGAAIGNSVNGHNGAWVGGAVGALAGSPIQLALTRIVPERAIGHEVLVTRTKIEDAAELRPEEDR